MHGKSACVFHTILKARTVYKQSPLFYAISKIALLQKVKCISHHSFSSYASIMNSNSTFCPPPTILFSICN